MTDTPIAPQPPEPRPRPSWVTPVGVALAVLALAFASFGLGRVTADDTVRMGPADRASMMQDYQGGMNGMPGMNGMYGTNGMNGMHYGAAGQDMPCTSTTTTTP